MIRMISTECRKLFMSSTFIFGCLLIFALSMTAAVYRDDDSGKAYTVLEALTALPASVRQNELSAFAVMLSGLSGVYGELFLPIAVGMGFVPLICTERRTNAARTQLIRTTKNQYVLGKIISIVLCGGCTVLFGFLLYCGFVWLTFPHIMIEDGLMLYGTPLQHFCKVALGKFLIGCVSVFPILLMCTISKQQYIILCMPVLFRFLMMCIGSYLISYEALQHYRYFMPEGASLLLFRFSWIDLLIVFVIPIICSVVFWLHLRKKVDCGE